MAKNIKNPVSGKVAGVPMVMQMEALECGAACLTMILAYYNKWIPLEKIRGDCGVSRDGSNAGNIAKTAMFYGLKAKGKRYEPEALKALGTFPCIVHWDFEHFVVVNGFKNNKVYLNDPARGKYHMDMETFDEHFTGVCIEFEPAEDFEPTGKPKSVLRFIQKRLTHYRSILTIAVLISTIITLAGIIRPAFGKVFLDSILPGNQPLWILPFFNLLFVLTIIEVIAKVVQSVYSFRISGKLDAIDSAAFMWHLLKMPLVFFSQRMAGDIQERQQNNGEIADLLVNQFAPLVINTIMLVIYFAVMVNYSGLLTLVGLLAFLFNIIISVIASQKRLNITRVSMRDDAKMNATTISGIDLMETIKSNGAENGFFAKWAGYLTKRNEENIALRRIDRTFGNLPRFMLELSDVVILILGAYLVMTGQFTLGMLLAFRGFMSAFMEPGMELIQVGQRVQEMRAQMERIDDVLEYPLDNVFSENPETFKKKLTGRVEVRNLSFKYSQFSDDVVKDVDFVVEPGSSIAIVGHSGCGKSSIARLMTGLYRPSEGEILYDGMDISELDRAVFSGSVVMVSQESFLFEDTIANNIKMWDASIEDFEMILAAKDAQIYDDIMKRPRDFQSMISEQGKNFSGGQRQRIEIARCLAQDPTIIILDEATSALDAQTEYEVVQAIRNRGITCIVVAHRMSTIRSCDKILVMDKGRVIARGTHKDLMKNCEQYKDMIIMN